MWPIRAPALVETDAIKDVFTFQDEKVNIMLGMDYISNVGEEVELVITSLPRRGQLWTYGVDWTWSSANARVIETASSQLALTGLAVTYKPEPGFRGRDQFVVAFRSPATGLSSVVLTVSVDVRLVDTTAQCEALGRDVVLDEDQVGGVPDIVLNASDKEQTFGLARIISKLPERGDLYVTSELGVERKVTAPYNNFRETGDVVRQYASRVEGFSTFDDAGGSDLVQPIRRHPLMVLSSPTCNDKGRTLNDECESSCLKTGKAGLGEQDEWKGWMPPAGDIIFVTQALQR